MTTDFIGMDDLKDRLLDAALPHVAFDGWTSATFAAALRDIGADPALARAVCPHGAVDLAVHLHQRGDRMMVDWLAGQDLTAMRFRDRVAAAIRYRLSMIPDKEAARRATTMFALPQHAAEGARALWGTADLVWTALGDTADDVNWYTKRASLSGVYGATLLYWLGDDSADHASTWEFLDRRIENVMQFEKLKSRVRENPLLKPLLAVPDRLLCQVRAPAGRRSDLPGRYTPSTQDPT